MSRVDGARKKRADVLAAVQSGMGPFEALRFLNLTEVWYAQSRTRHPDWARQVTDARLANNDTDLPGSEFIGFRKLYFGNDTAPHHYRMVEAFESAAEGSLTVVLAYPGCGKSTTLIDKYCHLLAVDVNNRICVISEGQDLSRKIIGQVSDRMSDATRFHAYHARYGPFKAANWKDNDTERVADVLKRGWTADWFRILAANADEKEPSLESRGAAGRIYGGRYDYLVFDDIQSNETLNRTDALMRSMRTSWKSRTILGDGRMGRMIMIGSRVGPGDIYEKLDDEGMISNLVTIPALTANIPRDEHYTKIKGKIVVNPQAAATPTWANHSMQHLAEIRDFVGETDWARTYMQDTVDDTAAIFTDELLEKAKDPHRSIHSSPPGIDVYGSVDPALDSGICAYMTASMNASHLYLLHSLTRTDIRTYTDTYTDINSMAAIYHPTRWIVERNNYQKGMLQDDRLRAIASARHFDLIEHNTGRNKHDPVMGVRMMANAFADGEISIPWADEDSRQMFTPLLEELRKWRPDRRGANLRQDRVMTLWFIWKHWSEQRRRYTMTTQRLPRPSWIAH